MPPPKAGAADVGVDVAPKSEDCSSDCESNGSVFRDTLETMAALWLYYHGVLYLVALSVSTTHPYLSSPARALGMQGVCCCRLCCETGLENGPFKLNPFEACMMYLQATSSGPA